MSDFKNTNLGWRSLLYHALAISILLVLLNGWIFMTEYSAGKSIELIGPLVAMLLSFSTLLLSLVASNGNCNPSRIVRVYAFWVLSFGCSFVMFSWCAHLLATPETLWIYIDYASTYVAIFILAIPLSVYYFQSNVKRKSYFATLLLRLEQDPSMPVIRAPDHSLGGNLTSAVILFVGAAAPVVAGLTLGRTAGALYTAFLFSLLVGPFFLGFWLVNVMYSYNARRLG